MTSIIRNKVFETAEELLREGKRPTQQLVRERIGSGSLTTINKGLNEWWSSLSQRMTQSDQGLDLPEPILRLSQRLWTESIGYARREFTARAQIREQEHAALESQMLEERRAFSEKLKELNDQTIQQQKTNRALEQQLKEMQQELQQSQDECYRLTRNQGLMNDANTSSNTTQEALLEARVRLQIQEEQMSLLFDKNQKLILENAELKLKYNKIIAE